MEFAELCCVQAPRAGLLLQRDLARADWQGLCAVGGPRAEWVSPEAAGPALLLTPAEPAFSFPGARDTV